MDGEAALSRAEGGTPSPVYRKLLSAHHLPCICLSWMKRSSINHQSLSTNNPHTPKITQIVPTLYSPNGTVSHLILEQDDAASLNMDGGFPR